MRIGEAAAAFGVGAAVTFLVIRATPSCAPEPPPGGIARVDTVRDTTRIHDTIPKIVVREIPADPETVRVGPDSGAIAYRGAAVVEAERGYMDTVRAVFWDPWKTFDLSLAMMPRVRTIETVTITRDSIVYHRMPKEWYERIAIGPGVGAFYNGERVVYAPAIGIVYDVMP